MPHSVGLLPTDQVPPEVAIAAPIGTARACCRPSPARHGWHRVDWKALRHESLGTAPRRPNDPGREATPNGRSVQEAPRQTTICEDADQGVHRAALGPDPYALRARAHWARSSRSTCDARTPPDAPWGRKRPPTNPRLPTTYSEPVSLSMGTTEDDARADCARPLDWPGNHASASVPRRTAPHLHSGDGDSLWTGSEQHS